MPRKKKPVPAIVFDQAMLDRAYAAAIKEAQLKSFTANPTGVLIKAIEAALQVKFSATATTGGE